MKRSLKLLSFGLIAFMLTITVNAKDVSTWADLKSCLENTTDTTCKITTNIEATDEDEALSVNGSKTLDLNTYTLTTKKSIFVETAGVFTVNGNGKITSSAIDKLIYVKAGGTFNVDAVELTTTKNTGRVIYIKGDAGDLLTHVTVGKDAVLSSNYVVMIASSDAEASKANGVTIDIYGTLKGIIGNDGWEYGGVAVYVNGTIKNIAENSPVINIYDGSKLEGKNAPAIYAAGYAVWNIGKATISGTEALSIKSDKFVVDGATLTANGEYVEPEQIIANKNGNEVTGASVSITSNSGYIGDIEVEIKNSTITSENGYALFEGVTLGDTSKVKKLSIVNSDFNGKIGALYIGSELTNFIESGKFSSDVLTNYLAEGKTSMLIEGMYNVNTLRTIESKEATNGEVSAVYIRAIAGQSIGLTATADEGYYLKNIRITNKNDSTEYFDIKDSLVFIMPDYDVVIEAEFAEEIKKETTIVETKPTLEVDASIESDLVDEMGEIKTDSTLIDAIDTSKLDVEDANLLEVKIKSTLKSVSEKDGKVTLVFDIKPVYSVDGVDKGVLANENLNGNKVKIKLPVPSSIKDTHAKVIHKEGETLVDEKDYEIKVDGDNKYIEIETSSFSEFTVNFYTPISNPQTFNSLTIALLTLIMSVTVLSITCVVLKNKKVFNR